MECLLGFHEHQWVLDTPFRPEEYARFQEGTVEGGKLIVKLCREYENAVKIQEPATAAAAQALVDAPTAAMQTQR